MGRPIKDHTLAFRTSTDAVTAANDQDASSVVEIKGGNELSPMWVFVEYWLGSTTAGAGAVAFSITQCATTGGTYTELVDAANFTVVLSTVATSGRLYLPYCNSLPFGKCLPTVTGTNGTIKYNAFLVNSRPGG